MSVSKWAYLAERCDGDYCCGDCDNCPKSDENMAIIAAEDKICEVCGKTINEGYCIDDGLEYYCSEECLRKKYTEEEYEEMYQAGAAYWSEWEENT